VSSSLLDQKKKLVSVVFVWFALELEFQIGERGRLFIVHTIARGKLILVFLFLIEEEI